MAHCFEGKLDICVVGKFGRETFPADFLWSLSSELFSFKKGMPEIFTWKLKSAYLKGNAFFQTIMFGILTFWGVFHSHQSASPLLGMGKASRCHVATMFGEKQVQLLPFRSQARKRYQIDLNKSTYTPENYREHQQSP